MPPRRAAINGEDSSNTGLQADANMPTIKPDPDALPATNISHLSDSIDLRSISPASIQSATPTTSVAPSRVGSISRTLSGRSASAARGSPAARGIRGGRGVSGAQTTAPSRFRPKAARRTLEERNQAAAEEEARQAAKDKDAAFLARIANRGRGRGRGRGDMAQGRGRGDAMGMRGGRRMDASFLRASGPFSQAAFLERKGGLQSAISRDSVGTGGGGSGGTGGGGGSSSGGRVKTEFGAANVMATDGSMIKSESHDPIYPEEAEDGQRMAKMDIESINLVSDEETGDEGEGAYNRKGKGRANVVRAARPIRLTREEHKGRVTMINTDSAAATLRHDRGKDEGDVTGALRRKLDQTDAHSRAFTGVWQDTGTETSEHEESSIKPDPDDPFTRPSSPVLGEIMDIDNQKATSSSAAKDGSSRGPKKKKEEPVIQTEEDREEYYRKMEDVYLLAEELGGLQTATDVDTSGDVDLDNPQDKGLGAQGSKQEGRLYLFQFPPILPPLQNPVKKEEPPNENPDVELSSVQAAPNRPDPTKVDLTKPDSHTEAIEIKPDPESGLALPNSKKRIPYHKAVAEAGYVGKLIIRESGKVELDWGGTSLQLGKGASYEFLTTTLIVDEDTPIAASNVQGQDESVRRGNGTGLGSVQGKFVATPDWDALFRDGKY